MSDAPLAAIYVFAAGAHGNVAPTATITGSNTKLNWPVAVAIESNKIVVANELTAPSITAYKLMATGNAAPAWTLAGSTTKITGPGGVAFDTSGDLFLADVSDAILKFAPAAKGNVAPIATIKGSNTLMGDPFGPAPL